MLDKSVIWNIWKKLIQKAETCRERPSVLQEETLWKLASESSEGHISWQLITAANCWPNWIQITGDVTWEMCSILWVLFSLSGPFSQLLAIRILFQGWDYESRWLGYIKRIEKQSVIPWPLSQTLLSQQTTPRDPATLASGAHGTGLDPGPSQDLRYSSRPPCGT